MAELKTNSIILNPPLRLGSDHIDYPQYSLLGVVSNAAALRAAGMDVSVSDAFSTEFAEVARDNNFGRLGSSMEALIGSCASDIGAVIVAVSPFLFPHVPTEHCAEIFKSVRASWPEARIIAADCYFSGMHYIEYEGLEFIRRHPEIDSVAKYETEARFAQIVRDCRRGSKEVVKCEASEVVIDDLPIPSWDLISLENYYSFQERYNTVFGHGKDEPFMRSLPVATTRGCPYGCSFCSSNPGQKTKQFRASSTDYVQKILAAYADDFGAEKIVFLESAPNLDKTRFKSVLEIVESLGLKCEFPNGLRADCLTKEHLKILKKVAGRVKISEESGCSRILDEIGKKLSLESSEETIGMIAQEGIPLEIHYVIGFPFETPEEANKTLQRAISMKERFGANPLLQFATPLPGSEMHARAEQLGLLSDFDPALLYSHFKGLPSFDRPGFPAEKLRNMMFCFQKRLADTEIDRVIINLTYECSNDCVFCAVGDRKRAHGDAERIIKHLKLYREIGVESVDFDGGEPTMFPGFMNLAAQARDLGYKNINVTTNARKLADRGAASRFLLSGLTSVLVSLHGHTPELHERHTRREGSFKETVKGIMHIVELKPGRVEFAINTTITEWNAPSFGEMLDLFETLGAGAVNAQFITPHGNARGFSGYDIERIAEIVAEPIMERRGRFPVRIINLAPCVARNLTGELDPETAKYSRDMVFVDSSPMNLGKYLDMRRMRKSECASCEAAVACAGFYSFEE